MFSKAIRNDRLAT